MRSADFFEIPYKSTLVPATARQCPPMPASAQRDWNSDWCRKSEVTENDRIDTITGLKVKLSLILLERQQVETCDLILLLYFFSINP